MIPTANKCVRFNSQLLLQSSGNPDYVFLSWQLSHFRDNQSRKDFGLLPSPVPESTAALSFELHGTNGSFRSESACCAIAHRNRKKPTWRNTRKASRHVGLLCNEPPGTPEVPFS
jgi:hypothetical protein